MNNTSSRTDRSICVEARFSRLGDLVALLDMPHLDKEASARAKLAIEELFANTIHHGYRGESDQPVWLAVESTEKYLKVSYSDAAPEFHPFESFPDLIDDSLVYIDNHPVGGLGRILAYQMASRCNYRREADRNLVTLEYELTTAA